MEDMTLLNQLTFWLFGGMMIAGALGVVFHRSIIYSALLLLVCFLSIAGFFVLLNAPFIAAAQVLVYAVGLTIVLLFGIMLTGDKPFVDPVGQEPSKHRWVMPAIVSAGFTGFVGWALLNPNPQMTQINGIFVPSAEPLSKDTLIALFADGGITHIGELLFSKYLIPFELASVLLLLAMIGAIILSKRVLPEEEGEALLAAEDDSLERELATSASKRGITAVSPSEDSEKQTLGVS